MGETIQGSSRRLVLAISCFASLGVFLFVSSPLLLFSPFNLENADLRMASSTRRAMISASQPFYPFRGPPPSRMRAFTVTNGTPSRHSNAGALKFSVPTGASCRGSSPDPTYVSPALRDILHESASPADFSPLPLARHSASLKKTHAPDCHNPITINDLIPRSPSTVQSLFPPAGSCRTRDHVSARRPPPPARPFLTTLGRY